MKKVFLFLLLGFPLLLFSQIGDKEMYGYSRVGVGIGLTDVPFTSDIAGNSQEYPVSTSLNLGAGTAIEFGLGLMLFRNLYIEPSLSYTFLSEKIDNNEAVQYYISKYSFNKISIGVSSVYIVVVDESFHLDLSVGLGIVMPQQLVVSTSHGVEKVNFNSAIGYHGGFGGNYIHNRFVYGLGLRYRVETYISSYDQRNSPNFSELNPKIDPMKVVGADVTLTVKYLF